MNLHKKGTTNFKAVNEFYNTHVLQKRNQHPNCKCCATTQCVTCKVPQAADNIFNFGIVVNKFYYSLFQILKSYAVSYDKDDTFEHKWLDNAHTLKSINKQALTKEIQSQIEELCNAMSSLRTLRNTSDYRAQVTFQLVREAKRYSDKAHNIIQNDLIKFLGTPLC